jgi:hypothetical protein
VPSLTEQESRIAFFGTVTKFRHDGFIFVPVNEELQRGTRAPARRGETIEPDRPASGTTQPRDTGGGGEAPAALSSRRLF